MEKKYADIINEGKKNGESIEVINTKLKEAGANFHLNPDGGTAGWTEAEMAEGFIPAEEEPKDAQRHRGYAPPSRACRHQADPVDPRRQVRGYL